MLFGLAPAVFASRANPNESLREGERGSSLGKSPARSALIAAEIALSLVLLVGAGLMMKSFVRLTRVDPGFNPDQSARFQYRTGHLGRCDAADNFYREVVERMQRGAGRAGGRRGQPAAARRREQLALLQRARRAARSYEADIRVSTPDYFPTMGDPAPAGPEIHRARHERFVPVAIINQATAANAFPGQNPIGQYLTNFGPKSTKSCRSSAWSETCATSRWRRRRGPEIYVPLDADAWPSMFVAVRSAVANPLSLLPAVQEAVWSIDRNVPLANPRTMQDVLAHSVLRRKFAMLLLSIFAGLATLLAAIGLYGVISYSVAQRTKEIGIRMALGGQRSDMLRMVLRQSGILVLMGLVIGVPVACSRRDC